MTFYHMKKLKFEKYFKKMNTKTFIETNINILKLDMNFIF